MDARHVTRTVVALALVCAALAPPAWASPTPAGRIYTVAGWMPPGLTAQDTVSGALGTSTSLELPTVMLELSDGSLLVSTGFLERRDQIIYRVSRTGAIRRFAGGSSAIGGENVRATRAGFDFVSAMAQLRDGSVLVADSEQGLVRRIGPNGRIRTVAGVREGKGLGGVYGFGGDGGPATRAKLTEPNGLAALPDGGYLIADSANNRVRRVAPDGTISTFAGNGRGRPSGDHGAATRAGVAEPFALAVQPGGGVLIAEAGAFDARNATHGPGGVRRVALNGKITTVAKEQVRSLVATNDGGFLAVPGGQFDHAAPRIIHVSARGRVRAVAGTRHRRSQYWIEFNAHTMNGVRPGAAHVDAEVIAPARDGGVYFNDLQRIRYWAPASPGRLAMALEPATLTSPRTLRAHVRLTRPARVVALARHHGHVVRRATATMSAGLHTLALGRPVAAGRYVLTVTATSSTSVPHRVSDTAVVLPGGVLTADAAREEAMRFLSLGGILPFREAGETQTVERCTSLSRTSADCVVARPLKQCSVTVEMHLRRNGGVVLRRFRGSDECWG